MTTPFKSNADALRAIMQAYQLTRGDVCRILGLKPRPQGGSSGTVDSWLAGIRGMPRAKLELVALKAPNYTRPAKPVDTASGASVK